MIKYKKIRASKKLKIIMNKRYNRRKPNRKRKRKTTAFLKVLRRKRSRTSIILADPVLKMPSHNFNKMSRKKY